MALGMRLPEEEGMARMKREIEDRGRLAAINSARIASAVGNEMIKLSKWNNKARARRTETTNRLKSDKSDLLAQQALIDALVKQEETAAMKEEAGSAAARVARARAARAMEAREDAELRVGGKRTDQRRSKIKKYKPLTIKKVKKKSKHSHKNLKQSRRKLKRSHKKSKKLKFKNKTIT